jgi:hypothetical protein
MERVKVTEYCGFKKPLEFASYYSSDHGVIKSCKHIISIDIHVSIVPPSFPPFRILHAFKWEATDRLESVFAAVDVSRLTRYQGRIL